MGVNGTPAIYNVAEANIRWLFDPDETKTTRKKKFHLLFKRLGRQIKTIFLVSGAVF